MLLLKISSPQLRGSFIICDVLSEPNLLASDAFTLVGLAGDFACLELIRAAVFVRSFCLSKYLKSPQIISAATPIKKALTTSCQYTMTSIIIMT